MAEAVKSNRFPREVKNPKKRRRRVGNRTTKKKDSAKQKQKQRQVVNVQVSSGGGGGTSGFIPIPQAPAFDYNLLANLIRPANTVDVPIRMAAPIPEPIAVRPAEPPALSEMMTQTEPFGLNPYVSESETNAPLRASRSDKGKSRGSYKEKAIIEGRNIQNIFALGGGTAGPSESESESFQVPVSVPKGSTSRFM